ncbi:MAG: hypothetical protein ACP5M0_15970 [Desulfomonilaceae bacterium]
MVTETLYQQSEILIAVALLGFMVLGGELGYRLGRRGRQTHNEQTRTQIISIQAATLGLLALLLGFTFAMALSRFEYRKQMVVQESNAIGTAALRSQFLPSSSDDEVSKLFRRYVEIRLESVLRTGQGSSEREQLDREVLQIQGRLWRIANEAAEADPRSIPLGLFTHAMNEVIDIKTRRDIAVANHVPESLLLLLMGFSILGAVALGYGNGLAGRRIMSLTAAYCVIVVLVIVLIIDLDHPQHGLAHTSQQSMIQLQELLNAGRR